MIEGFIEARGDVDGAQNTDIISANCEPSINACCKVSTYPQKIEPIEMTKMLKRSQPLILPCAGTAPNSVVILITNSQR
jgi:hypothetical protein